MVKVKKVREEEFNHVLKQVSNKMGRDLTLPELREKILQDDDKETYLDEYLVELEKLDAQFLLAIERPNEIIDHKLMILMNFICQLSGSYGKESKWMVEKIIDNSYHIVNQLTSTTYRLAYVQCLINIRSFSKNRLLTTLKLLEHLLKFYELKDKRLRLYIRNFMRKELKRIFSSKRRRQMHDGEKIRKYLFSILRSTNSTFNERCDCMIFNLIIRMYRTGIWADMETANFISDNSFSTQSKLQLLALNFISDTKLKNEKKILSDGEEDDDENGDREDDDKELESLEIEKKNVQQLLMSQKVKKVKKTKHSQKKYEKMMENIQRKRKLVKNLNHQKQIGLSIIQRLNNPTAFVEKLFDLIQKKMNHLNLLTQQKMTRRLLIVDIMGKIMNYYKLNFPSIINYLIKQLQPSSTGVIRLLTAAVQCVPDHSPDFNLTQYDEMVDRLSMTICNNFISEHNNIEIILTGFNTILQICYRSPYSINEDLINDLCQYVTYNKDKNVMRKARELINFYMVNASDMLASKWKSNEQMKTILEKEKIQLANKKRFEKQLEEVQKQKSSLIHSTVTSKRIKRLEKRELFLLSKIHRYRQQIDRLIDHDNNRIIPAAYDVLLDEEMKDDLTEKDFLSSTILSDTEFRKIRREQLKRETVVADKEKMKKEEFHVKFQKENGEIEEVTLKEVPKRLRKVVTNEKDYKNLMKRIDAARNDDGEENDDDEDEDEDEDDDDDDDDDDGYEIDEKDELLVELTKNMNKRKDGESDSENDDDDDDDEEDDQFSGLKSEFVSMADIGRVRVKRAHDKANRLKKVMEGREDREKFTGAKNKKKVQRCGLMAGLSNKQQNKKKNWSMLQHKVKSGRNRRSFSEKQRSLKASLLKRLKS
ncbi:hypothetical protein SNEBB_001666 [Seison nebaliae]|nr:hypothetical protein SNEBB_001666 [Seison nebaliae]